MSDSSLCHSNNVLLFYKYSSDLTEPNWKLNAVVSTLSTGPVGPSDMVGATNVEMLMK